MIAAVFDAVIVAWLNVAASITGTCAAALAVHPTRAAMTTRPRRRVFFRLCMVFPYFVAGAKKMLAVDSLVAAGAKVTSVALVAS